MTCSVSGRPQSGEFADYAKADIDLVVGEDIVHTLRAQMTETPVDDDSASRVRYAPGKWNLKQVIGHLGG